VVVSDVEAVVEIYGAVVLSEVDEVVVSELVDELVVDSELDNEVVDPVVVYSWRRRGRCGRIRRGN
jgi:hypothetical protein